MINLPRHMRNVHGWPNSEAKYVKALYGKRKKFTFKSKRLSTKKRHRFNKACPIFGCRAVVQNMSKHLHLCHKLERNASYKKLLKKAIVVDYMMKKNQSYKTQNNWSSESYYDFNKFVDSDLPSETDDSSYVPTGSEADSYVSTCNISTDSNLDIKDACGFSKAFAKEVYASDGSYLPQYRQESEKKVASKINIAHAEDTNVKFADLIQWLNSQPSVSDPDSLSSENDSKRLGNVVNATQSENEINRASNLGEPVFEKFQKSRKTTDALPLLDVDQSDLDSLNESSDERLSNLSASTSLCESFIGNLHVQNNLKKVELFLDSFFEYMTSPDYGNLDTKTASSCCSRVKKLAMLVEYDLEDLFDKNAIREKFLRCYCKEKNLAAVTRQAYLVSLEHFCNFLLSEHSQEFDVVKIQSMKSRLQAWKGSFTKEKNISAMKKMEIERKTKITPSDINNFEASDAVRSIIKTLGKMTEIEVTVSRTLFTDIRDFLIIQIFIDNAHRAGVIANMTIKEFSR